MESLGLLLLIIFLPIPLIFEAVEGLHLQREQGTQENSWYYHAGDGLQYHLSERRGISVYFKCVRYERGCRGRGVYRRGEGFSHSQEHNHDPDPFYVDEMRMRQEVLEACTSGQTRSFRDIIDNVGRRYHWQVAARVTLPRMRTSMRNARLSTYPEMPTTLQELTNILMTPRYRVLTMTDDGLDNVYLGSVTAADFTHHVVFTSRRLSSFLESCTVVHSDGTFKIVPEGLMDAYQVFVIAASFAETTIPIAWVLMSSATEAGYTAVLSLIRDRLNVDVPLDKCITDFEPAMRNGWRNAFPDIDYQGCFWHFCRSVLRYAVGLGLTWWVRNSIIARCVIRRLCALALLPRHVMCRGFILIAQWATARADPALNDQLQPLFHYMWDFWINNVQRSRWICVHDSEERTNNILESHNRRLRDIMGIHPNVYTLLDGFIRLERTTVRDLCTLYDGNYQASRRRRISALVNDARLQALSDNLNRTVRRRNRLHRNPRVRMQYIRQLNNAIWIYISRASRIIENAFNEAFDLEN